MRILFQLYLLILPIILFSQTLKPTEEFALVEITFTDDKNVPIANEEIFFVNKADGNAYFGRTNEAGKAQILVPKNNTYIITYKEKIFRKEYTTITIPYEEGLVTYNFNIVFKPSKQFILHNVEFETGSSVILPSSYAVLDELVGLLKSEKKLKIEVSGHTDNLGNKDVNLKLSKNRAEAVRQYLLKKGIEPHRVRATGYGDTRPIAKNDTPEGRQKNRRIEIRFLD